MNRRLFLRIEHDPDAEDPCENDGFKLYSFNSRHNRYCNPEKLPISHLGLQNKLRADTAFWLDYYEHGLGRWSLSGDGMQCRWDTSRRAGILIWEPPARDLNHTPELRREAAKGFLQGFTEWWNGNAYCFALEDEDGDTVESCCGIIVLDDNDFANVINDYLEDDDVICVCESEFYDVQYIRRKLKGRVLDTPYFPTTPQPEYAI